MKKPHTFRAFLAGVLLTLFLVSIVPSALASGGKTISVFPGVNIYIDDVKLDPKDVNGNPVEVFVYNGTTYLPVRAVSEAFGKPVQWDGSTNSVYVGKHSSTTPVAWLGQMDYFNKNCSWYFDAETKDNLGNTHLHSIGKKNNLNGEAFVSYKLNGQYSRLTALYYMQFDKRDSYRDRAFTLVISGDGRDLWQGTVGAGLNPVNIDIDITGVLELTIKYPESRIRDGEECTALGEVALWS